MLKDKGFKKCADATTAITGFVYKKETFAFLNLWNQSDPDRHAAITLATKTFPDVGPTFTTITAVPNAAGTCDGTFTYILVSESACAVIRETVFKEWKYYGEINGTPIYEDPTSANVVVTLAQMKSVCLVAKSGSLFFDK